jgi:beta-alanine--pyruvate transaminase
MDIYKRDGLFERVKEMAPYFEDALHSLKGLPGVIDVRNYGLMGAVEYEPFAGKPGARGFDTFVRAFDAGILVRAAGDITALSPPFIVEKSHIDELVEKLGKVIRETKV